jgi:hypothetical protein
MRYLKYAGLLGLFVMLAGTAAHAQVRFGVGVGVGPGYVPPPAYVGPAPNCAYGYYGYYPYACAPYGYYGPSYFNSGVFIGAGPWFHRGYYGPGFRSFGPNFDRGFHGGEGFRDFRGGGFRGSVGGGFRGGNQFRSGGGFRGGVSRGGGRR